MSPIEKFADASAWMKLLVTAVIVGIAWGAMQASVAYKVDRSEYLQFKARADSVDTHLSNQLQMFSNEVLENQKVVLYLLCKDHPRDSACKGKS